MILRLAGRAHAQVSNGCSLSTIRSGQPSHLAQFLLRPFFSTSAVALGLAATPKKKRPKYRDPYANRLAEARKQASLARRATIQSLRAASAGDPIRGVPTPFVESFDTAMPPVPPPPSDANHTTASTSSPTSTSHSAPPSAIVPPLDSHLNHLITPSVLHSAINRSHQLAAPYITPDRATADPAAEAAAQAAHSARHATATTALNRILTLRAASSRSRTRANIARCIATFGRHHTDGHVAPRAPSATSLDPRVVEAVKTPRAGPDVGSSEVQIAILTAKIRVLADRWQAEARKDKANKRNLRLLLHRRQKLLRYMLRQERGSGRWHHMVKTLGLTPATWEGQITVEDWMCAARDTEKEKEGEKDVAMA